MNKILICGYARHGKDTVAERLRDTHGLRFTSSSQKAAEIFIFDQLKFQLGYKTKEECYEDRMNHRELWYNMITDYNSQDKTRLTRAILADNDCYVGLRSVEEFDACVAQNLFARYIWVDAGERLPPESVDSCPLREEYFCSKVNAIVIDNNKTQEHLHKQVDAVVSIIFD